jgi:sugar phosphate isomerase/epimerase
MEGKEIGVKRDQIALQMWTLRDVMDRGVEKIYAKVAEIGYTGVEIGDTAGLAPAAFRKMIDDLGLVCMSRHVGMGYLEADLDRTADEIRTIGGKYLTVAYLDKERRPDADGYRRCADQLNKLAVVLAGHGLTLLYHNHSFEFENVGGGTGYDLLLPPAPTGNLRAELDVYWAVHGGQDPVAMINRMPGRVPLLHMKDMAPGPAREFCEVGEGIIDMPAVVVAGDRAGVQWYIVEQDECKRDPLESVAMSYGNLAGLCAG